MLYMLTTIKIKLLHIFKLKLKFLCCYKHFKNTNTPAVHGRLANIGASSFLPIIELIRYFASWCIYLLKQTFTPTHVCTYNMV